MRPSTALLFACLCVALLGARPAQAGIPAAEQGRMAFRTYGAQEGLTNLKIWSMAQDAAGFIWIGTVDGGLFRYDGQRFVGFDEADGLPNPSVRALLPTSDGGLWIGTTGGLARFTANGIEAVDPASGLPQTEIFSLAQDVDGRVYVGSREGLFYSDPRGRTFESLSGARSVRSVWLSRRGLYASSEQHLLHWAAPGIGPPTEIEGPWRGWIDGVLEDGEGRLWVRGRNELWMRARPDAAFEDWSTTMPGPGSFDGSIVIDGSGGVLVPSVGGVTRIGAVRQVSVIGEDQGLPDPWVSRAMIDHEGSMWLAGVSLHRALGGGAWWQFGREEGIPGGAVESILLARSGDLWLGTVDGIARWTGTAFERVPESRGRHVRALVETPAGDLWLAGGGALERWNPTTGRLDSVPIEFSTYDLMVDENVLWIASNRRGLQRLRLDGDTFAVEREALPDEIDDNRIQLIHRGASGKLWIADSSGILRRDGDRWFRFGQSQGMPDESVSALLESRPGELWLAYRSRDGLAHFRIVNDRLQPMPTPPTLPPGQIGFIRQDAHGTIWVGSSAGLIRLSEPMPRTFNSDDGLPADQISPNAFAATDDGVLLVGTARGLARGSVDLLRQVPLPAPRVLALRLEGGWHDQPAAGIVLPEATHALGFRVAVLSYLGEQRQRYRYRLSGLDDMWLESDSSDLNFSNLHAGAYTFEVAAADRSGAWGPDTRFPFSIAPAWWEHPLARVLGLGVLAFLLLWLFRWRSQHLAQRNQELEALVASRTAELAEANRALREVSLTDPLTGLRNRRHLDLSIHQMLAQAQRARASQNARAPEQRDRNIELVFLMVDLDQFKEINDRHGHAGGDRVLQQVRDRLLQALREGDIIVRWGGDEFLVLAQGVDARQCGEIAERIRLSVRGRPFELADGPPQTITCSIGFAVYPTAHGTETPWQRVVEVADRCLYAAKHSGRDAWVGLCELPTRPEHLPALLADPALELPRLDVTAVSNLPPERIAWS